MILANGQEVKVSEEEMKKFITIMPAPIPNPFWEYSEILTKEEVERYLKGTASLDELKTIGKYMVVFFENIAFAGYLTGKAQGEKPNLSEQFNVPELVKARKMNEELQQATDLKVAKRLCGDIDHLCTEVGVGGI
jgi:hypothetical protein